MAGSRFSQALISIGRLSSVLITMLLPLGAAAGPLNPAPASVAFWYAEKPPLGELSQFDWVVFEPEHLTPADVSFVVQQGSKPFAYISIGELDDHQAQSSPGLLSYTADQARNISWNSHVMDLTSAGWRDHIFSRVAEFEKRGYAGLFLDTLDSFSLLAEARRPAQRDALLSLLQALHKRHPQMKLFFNRGFEILPEMDNALVAAVAVESIHAGWDARTRRYRPVPQADREWLSGQLQPLRERNIPLVAIEYLPPERRNEARQLAQQLLAEGFTPFITTPELNYLGVSSIEVQPRRIALLYDPREGELYASVGFVSLGGLLEYLGYRVDYLPVDGHLPESQVAGLYAGAVIWMASGAPAGRRNFEGWLETRLDEGVPLAFMSGMPINNAALLGRLGLRRNGQQPIEDVSIVDYDPQLLGQFEAPLVARARNLIPLGLSDTADDKGRAALVLTDSRNRQHTPVALFGWGGVALAPYVFDGSGDSRRWILDPFTFLQRALRLSPMPAPDATTENGRRIATVHIDGDGFPSRAEIPGTPYSGEQVLKGFIEPHPLLTSVSVIEGEVGPQGMFPYLARELEPLARRIFAHERVEPATHTFSHPFFWQPEKATIAPDLRAAYGLKMAIPGYDQIDFTREILGSRDYINERLLPPGEKVQLLFWSGDALPSAATVKMSYQAGLLNVNGGRTKLTRADPSLTGLYPLLRPTEGGLQVYAPIINENVYTNLWQGPYYGFRDVIDTFDLTDLPRRMRGLHLYYHFYSGTKPGAIKVMGDIYRYILQQDPLSLWMSDYLRRVHGLHTATLARTAGGAWQIRALQGLRTLRLDPALGWPDLLASEGVAGVHDLPQGRYVHLSSDRALLVLQPDRDSAPSLEQANVPLTSWIYRDAGQISFSFKGEFPVRFSVRHRGRCHVEYQGRRINGSAAAGLWHFTLPVKEVSDARLLCT